MSGWRKRFWTLTTVLLFVAFAFHPELRVLLFLLDVVGAELLVALLAFQFKLFFSGALTPLFYQSWRLLVPVIAAVNHATNSLYPLRFLRDLFRCALFNWVGNGPRTWHYLHTLLRTVEQGPGNGRNQGSGPLLGT